jgi:hypothetical protein
MIKNSIRKYSAVFATRAINFVCGAFVWHKVELNPITIGIVSKAEKIIGLNFTSAQSYRVLVVLQLPDPQKNYHVTICFNKKHPTLNF